MPDDCYSKEFVDADKVYSKRAFFKIKDSYSIEKVTNIFRNMDNYISQRSKLSARLTEQLARLEKDGYSSETLQAIIETENLLDDFCPQEQSAVEKSLNLTDLTNAVEILQKAQGLVGGENED